MASNATNHGLHEAKADKQVEFYAQSFDIQKGELTNCLFYILFTRK